MYLVPAFHFYSANRTLGERATGLLCSLGFLCHPCWALSFADFSRCVGAQGQGRVCQLDSGTYPVNTTINIARSNITILGGSSRAGDTILQRAPGFQDPIFRDLSPPSAGLTGITIRSLTLDGNRSQMTLRYSSYAPEVSFFTTKSVLVSDCRFVDSPNIGLALYGAGTAGVVVNRTYFGNPVTYGFWGDATGNNGGNTFRECPAKQFPDGIVMANSQFEKAGEPAILGSFRNIQILNNTFSLNHSVPIPFDDDGGQIDLTVCTEAAAVMGNTFTDGFVTATTHVVQGVEAHGSNIAIVDNEIKGHTGDGISLGGASEVFVANWDSRTGVHDNGTGVSFSQGTSSDSLRPVANIVIDHANITSNTDWGLWSKSATDPLNHIFITNNCVKDNGFGATSLSGLGADIILQTNLTSGCVPK